MWDWCGYFGPAGEFCLRVEKKEEAYVIETSDEREEKLKEKEMKCFSPYGVCVEISREKEGFKAIVYSLAFQQKLAEVRKK